MGCLRGFVSQILKAASKLCLDLYFKGYRLDLMDFPTQYVYTGTRKVFLVLNLNFSQTGTSGSLCWHTKKVYFS